MGILERLGLRKKGTRLVEDARYILKRQAPGRGMIKVMELAVPQSIDELTPHLEPGIYALHKYKKGQSGFEVVWGPYEVLGESKPRAPRVETAPSPPAGGFIEFIRQFRKMRDEAKEDYQALKEVFEGKSFTIDDMVDAMAKMKERYVSLGKFFGPSSSGEESPQYEGKLPIWLHPKAIPEVIDQSLDKIERRMSRWGLIGEQAGSVVAKGEPIMKLPEKPKVEAEVEAAPVKVIDVKEVTDVIKEAVEVDEGKEEGGEGESESESSRA